MSDSRFVVLLEEVENDSSNYSVDDEQQRYDSRRHRLHYYICLYDYLA